MAVAIGTTSSTTNSSATISSTQNLSHNSTGGSDYTLVVGVAISDRTMVSDTQVTAVTYNSVSMTEAATGNVSIDYGADDRLISSLWFLNNPSSGSNNVTVTFNEDLNNGVLHIMAIDCSGAGNGIGANEWTTSGIATSVSTSATSVATDSKIVGMSCTQVSNTTFTPGTSYTEHFELTGSGTASAMMMSRTGTGTASTAFDFTQSANRRHCVVAFEVLASAGGGGISIPVVMHNRRQQLRSN